MFEYIVRLLIMVPLVCGMAFGALWLWRKYQPGMIGGGSERTLKIVEALPMGTFGKLAVVEFDGKRMLIAMTRGRIEKLADGGAIASAPPLTPPTAQSLAERFGRAR